MLHRPQTLPLPCQQNLARFKSHLLSLTLLDTHITFPPFKNLNWDFQRNLLELDVQMLLHFQPVFIARSQSQTVISLVTVV